MTASPLVTEGTEMREKKSKGFGRREAAVQGFAGLGCGTGRVWRGPARSQRIKHLAGQARTCPQIPGGHCPGSRSG